MRRNLGLKRRERGNLPPEKLQEILSGIFPKKIVNELMDEFVGTDNQAQQTEKGGAQE